MFIGMLEGNRAESALVRVSSLGYVEQPSKITRRGI